MADWTAITGIVVSGALGPSLIAFWSTKRQQQEAASAVALADRAAARDALNEAARAVREAVGRGSALKSAAMTWGDKLGREGGREQMEAFSDAGRAADLLGPRVEMMSVAGALSASRSRSAERGSIASREAPT